MSDTRDLTRPIIGIENRTAQEVFDIMADRFRGAFPPPPQPQMAATPGYRLSHWKDGTDELETALDAFWNAAYQQGWSRTGHDDREGSAQQADDNLRRAIAAMSAPATHEQAIETGAKILATWIGYEWDSLSDRDISEEYADWVGHRTMQGGKPALRKVAQRILASAPPPPVPQLRVTDDTVERVAKALALDMYPDARWPRDEADANSGVDDRQGRHPISWHFANKCRSQARAAIAVLSPSPTLGTVGITHSRPALDKPERTR